MSLKKLLFEVIVIESPYNGSARILCATLLDIPVHVVQPPDFWESENVSNESNADSSICRGTQRRATYATVAV